MNDVVQNREPVDAAEELAAIRSLMRRSSERVDAHAFHFVHWGLLVLVWFPLDAWLWSRGENTLAITIGVSAVVLGCGLSAWREARLARNPRVPGEDTRLARQAAWIAYGSVIPAMILSGVLPANGLIDGRSVPLIWGLAYANMAFMTGVVFRTDFKIAGAAIFAGVVVAWFFPKWQGYILGVCMGLGMLIPGLRAERRLRTLAHESTDAT